MQCLRLQVLQRVAFIQNGVQVFASFYLHVLFTIFMLTRVQCFCVSFYVLPLMCHLNEFRAPDLCGIIHLEAKPVVVPSRTTCRCIFFCLPSLLETVVSVCVTYFQSLLLLMT